MTKLSVRWVMAVGILWGAAALTGCACGPCGGDDGCPEGSSAKGDKPPDGNEWWCEKDGEEGVKHGPYAKWFESGQQSEEGQFQDGSKVGSWKAWYEGGQVNWEAEFFEGKKDGRYVSYYDNGNKRSEGEYAEGKMDGPWTEFHKSGKTAAEGDMVDGEKHGRWIFFNTRGEKDRTVKYKGGVEQSVKKGNGAGNPTLVDAPEVAIGKKDPRCIDDGQILGNEPPLGDKLWCEKDGKPHGMWKQWWENGNRWIEGQYTNGNKSGTWLEYYDNGIETSKGNYASGRKSGPWKFRYANGQVREEGEYASGKKTGTWTEYHEDGRQKGVKQF